MYHLLEYVWGTTVRNVGIWFKAFPVLCCEGREVGAGGGMVYFWDPSFLSFFWAPNKSPVLGGREG